MAEPPVTISLSVMRRVFLLVVVVVVVVVVLKDSLFKKISQNLHTLEQGLSSPTQRYGEND